MKTKHFIVLSFVIALIISATLIVITQNKNRQVSNANPKRDMLAYVSDGNHLMLYDPRERAETKLLDNVRSFVIGQNGHVAFTKLDENDTDLYVFDPSTPAIAPINISQNPAANHYPLAWSPDGRYLAFRSYQDVDNQSLYIWDGITTTNIMPDNGLDTARGFYLDWSYDGRIAFTIQYGWTNLDTPAEIYLWDGSTTTNLSQNPKDWDSAARWSRTGKLLFGSHRNGEDGIYVWDGTSFKDDSPDIDSFVRLPPELESSSATWIDDGAVAFTAYPNPSSLDTKVIMLWDPERDFFFEQYSVASKNAWSQLAEGGQVILSSHLASGVPSYYLDVENIEGEILFSTHTGEYSWSSDGYLAYCGIEEGMSRILSIWNGADTWVVTRVSYKPVRWQYGRDVFSCNNG
jgi:hypothetical protein